MRTRAHGCARWGVLGRSPEHAEHGQLRTAGAGVPTASDRQGRSEPQSVSDGTPKRTQIWAWGAARAQRAAQGAARQGEGKRHAVSCCAITPQTGCPARAAQPLVIPLHGKPQGDVQRSNEHLIGWGQGAAASVGE